MADATSVTIREEVVSSSKGVGHNWAPSTDEITPHQVPLHKRAEAGKGVVSELKLHTSGSSDSNAEKGNPAGTTLEKEDARELTSHSPSFGSSPLNQDKPSLSSLGGVKPVLVLTRIKDEHSKADDATPKTIPGNTRTIDEHRVAIQYLQ